MTRSISPINNFLGGILVCLPIVIGSPSALADSGGSGAREPVEVKKAIKTSPALTLKRNAQKIVSIYLLSCDGKHVSSMNEAEMLILKKAISRARFDDGASVTTPPWESLLDKGAHKNGRASVLSS